MLWYNLLTDIDERKNVEEKLRRSEAFLLEAQSMSRTGSWRHNLVTGELTVSPEVLRMRGVPTDFKPGTIEFFFKSMHPEDRLRVRETYEAARASKRDFAADYRILLPEGTLRYMHTVGHPVINTSGEVLEFAGTGIEITEQVEARIQLEKALEEIQRLKDRLQDENMALREEVVQASMFEEIVGSSPALQATLTSISMVAPTDSTVLVSGETGTGKELIARAIHKRSRRADRAFVTVNCAAIPRRCRLGALRPREGRVHRCDAARAAASSWRTGARSSSMRSARCRRDSGALLRVLQERSSSASAAADAIRWTCASSPRPTATWRRPSPRAFRSDLFYRLNVFPIDVPPLRDRKEDIPLLVEYFVKRFADKMGKDPRDRQADAGAVPGVRMAGQHPRATEHRGEICDPLHR